MATPGTTSWRRRERVWLLRREINCCSSIHGADLEAQVLILPVICLPEEEFVEGFGHLRSLVRQNGASELPSRDGIVNNNSRGKREKDKERRMVLLG